MKEKLNKESIVKYIQRCGECDDLQIETGIWYLVQEDINAKLNEFGKICLYDIYKIVTDRAGYWWHHGIDDSPIFSIDWYIYGYNKLYGCKIDIMKVNNYGEDEIPVNRKYYYRLRLPEPNKL